MKNSNTSQLITSWHISANARIAIKQNGKRITRTMAKANQKMWQRALWIAILPAIFAVLLPIILIGYAPLLVIVLIIKKVRK